MSWARASRLWRGHEDDLHGIVTCLRRVAVWVWMRWLIGIVRWIVWRDTLMIYMCRGRRSMCCEAWLWLRGWWKSIIIRIV